MRLSKKQQILRLLNERGILRPRDLDKLGIARVYLNKLHKEGIVDRPTRGLYTLPEAGLTQYQTIIEASKRVPHGKICLLTALQFHELTTQSPFEIWMAIDVKARLPEVRFSTDSFCQVFRRRTQLWYRNTST